VPETRRQTRYYWVLLHHEGVLFDYTKQVEFLDSCESNIFLQTATLRAALIHTALSSAQIEFELQRTCCVPYAASAFPCAETIQDRAQFSFTYIFHSPPLSQTSSV
jgi:hypothetical protein